MHHLNVSTPIARSQTEVYARLEKLFETYAPTGQMRFVMRAPLAVPGLNVGVTLQRDVISNVNPLRADSHAYNISWQAAEPGPFPTFSGAIFVGPDEEQKNHAVLTLDGRYEAPLSVAGHLFDAAIGKHIAEASARDLVERLTTFIDGSSGAGAVLA